MLSPLVGYAATALGHLATSRATPLQVRDIAATTGIPAPYLSKIVHQLARKGLLTTRRGVGGGVQLAVDPESITLYDLCETLDDPILRAQCLLGLGTCSDDEACPAHEFSRDIRRRQIEFLRTTTLADIGRFDAQRRLLGTPERAAQDPPRIRPRFPRPRGPDPAV